MLSRSAQFDTVANGQMRRLSWVFKASFDKAFDSNVEFFTLDQSLLDGIDVLAPSDDNVIQEWDKYDYDDYSNRIISMEWQREEDFPYSVNLAIADVVLNNTDDYFTPDSGSAIAQYVLPRRPIRLLGGFDRENLPGFVGLTEKMPVIDDDKTASFHAMDFLSQLFSKPLDQSVIYLDKRTDEILSALFILAGLTTSQIELDVAINTIPFTYFEKGTTYGSAIRQLMQAELGSLFMDEMGIIRFINRTPRSTTPVYYFDKSNTISMKLSREDNLINSVKIKGKVRVVQVNQPIYNLSEPQLVPANSTISYFYDFEDPVTTIDTIQFYTANSAEDGSGSDLTANISVDSTDEFAESMKVTWENNSGTDAYIIDLVIYGTPAKVVKNIYYTVENSASVAKYEEQILEIENDFVQSTSIAESIGLTILTYYAEYSSVIELEVKGNPALQIGDAIGVSVDFTVGNYIISKITNKFANGKFSQTITAKLFRPTSFFTLDVSVLDGTDLLSP